VKSPLWLFVMLSAADAADVVYVTPKLVSSDESDVGTASFAPPELTIVIADTFAPNDPIGPAIPPTVASHVAATAVWS
jgi:hypothetical protein